MCTHCVGTGVILGNASNSNSGNDKNKNKADNEDNAYNEEEVHT